MSHPDNDEWYDTIRDLPEGEQNFVEPPEDISHEDYEEILIEAELENQFLDNKEDKAMLIDSEAVNMLIKQQLYVAEATDNAPVVLALNMLLADIAQVEEREMERTVQSLING